MNIRLVKLLALSLAVAMVPIGQTAIADVLIFKNGDRISGEISRIWDSKVTIEPEYSDEFKVDISALAHIESQREFDIELGNGDGDRKNLVATFAGADSDGNQLINAGGKSIAVPLAKIFELHEPEKAFEWDSNVELSATFNSGNTDSENTVLRADTTLRFSDHRHLGEISFARESLAGSTTKDKDLLKYNYNWLFRDPWFFSTQLSFERDPIIELDQRIILSVGIGRDIWLTPRKELSVQLGFGGQTEQIGFVTTDSSVGTWALRYRQDFFADNLELYHNHSITANISGRTNTSYKTTTGLRFEITDLLYATLSLDYNYETDPVDTAENEDIALLVGLGLEF